jgi:hypothetical protein
LMLRESFDLSNYLEWAVRRRYQQFARLHRALEQKDHVATEALPKLPSKHAALGFFTQIQKKEGGSVHYNEKDSAFLVKRLAQLELYLQQVINNNVFQIDEVSHIARAPL